MKKSVIAALALAFALLAPPAARAAEFNRQCSVTGGSAQQLSAVLSTCGYTGTVSLSILTIRNPDTNANDLYYGQSDVSAVNGNKLMPGEGYTWPPPPAAEPIDASRIYLFVSGTQNASITLHGK